MLPYPLLSRQHTRVAAPDGEPGRSAAGTVALTAAAGHPDRVEVAAGALEVPPPVGAVPAVVGEDDGQQGESEGGEGGDEVHMDNVGSTGH
jgi:hypothetical protein